jgi:hypothetical protein
MLKRRLWPIPLVLIAAVGIAACGGDDEEAAVTVTETTASTPVEEATVPTETAEGETEVTEIPSGPEGNAEITNTLRELNRDLNLGQTQEACDTYFSEAFMARLSSERECANTLAGAREGAEKAQLVVGGVDSYDDGTAFARVVITPEGSDDNLFRDIDFVYENGAWKIDAVTNV